MGLIRSSRLKNLFDSYYILRGQKCRKTAMPSDFSPMTPKVFTNYGICEHFRCQIPVVPYRNSSYRESCAHRINDMLNPVQALSAQANSVDGKHVCLSGNFAYSSKSVIEKYIIAHGGVMDSSVKKSTDILIIGDNECQAYSNGTYGTKVKKAMEYNEKGCKIQIIKEADFVFEK